MPRLGSWIAAVLLTVPVLLPTSHGREVQPLAIGAAAPDFSLPGVDDKIYTLRDFTSSRILMVIFTCNHCPTAQAYEERIIQLHRDYRDRGVAVVAISPNDPLAVRLDELGYTDVSDSLAEMKIRAKDRGFQFPYLYDGETQDTSAAYGVLATPQVYIFDEQRKLRYVGRIDDSDIKTVQSPDARNALDALLAGKPVPVEKTRVFGCSTKWSDKRDTARQSLATWDREKVELQKIDGPTLKKRLAAAEGRFQLITVWATWCIPCISELPEFVAMNRMYRKRKFELITISADEPDHQAEALEVLTKNHVAATNYLFESDRRDELFDAIDPRSEGALPLTVLLGPDGKVVYRHNGVIDPLALKKVIADNLGRTYASR